MDISRRSLLAGFAAAPALTSAVRPLFALRNDLIYMNAANLAPCSKAALAAYQAQLADFQANPSFQNREVYKTLSESVRARLAKLVGAQPDEIALTRNASEGNNLVPRGLTLRSGDEVLITSHNHPSNTQSWEMHAKAAGARVVTVAVPMFARTPTEVTDSIARHVTPRTRVIAVSHFTNTTGLLYPIKDIADLAHRNNGWCHVDGAQSFGWMDLNLPALAIDSYTGSRHKWPMGPLESGMLYVRASRLPELAPAILSIDYWSDKPAGARKFEMLGQRDDPKLRGIEKTLEMLEELGLAKVQARALEISSQLRKGILTVPGTELIGSGEAAVSGPVVKVAFRGQPLEPLYNRLWSRHRIAIAKTDSGEAAGLRFSPYIYNTEEEVQKVVLALREKF